MIDFNEYETRLIVQLAPMVSQTTRCFVNMGSTNQLLDHLENRSGTRLTPQRIQSVPHRNLPIPIFCGHWFYKPGTEPVVEQIQDQIDGPSKPKRLILTDLEKINSPASPERFPQEGSDTDILST